MHICQGLGFARVTERVKRNSVDLPLLDDAIHIATGTRTATKATMA